MNQNDQFEDFLSLKDVKRILGCSYFIIIQHIKNGLLPAYKVTGTPISREEVQEHTYGLRIKPSDLRQYIQSTEVK